MNLILSDIKRYRNHFTGKFEWNEPSLLVIVLYRIGAYIRTIKITPLRWILSLVHLPFFGLFSVLLGISIPRGAKIGKGLRIYHFGGVVINPIAIIGENCSMHQGVTIGVRHTYIDVPTIGNNVTIGAGAKILGNIHIGDNVVIGANAVVLTDVPNNYIAVGVPAKIFPKKHIKNELNNDIPW